MAEKHLTSSKEAAELETNPEYVTVGIVTEGKQKYGVFEKVKKEPEKVEPKEVKKK